MAEATGINCKVCRLGEIIRITEYRHECRPVSWREHFFGRLTYFEILVDKRNLFERVFKRIWRPDGEAKVNSYLHCNVCGVKYEFLPAHNLQEPKPYASLVQTSPNSWSGGLKRSTG